MIIFKTENIEIDLSGYGVSLNEESNIFSDNLYKSYSLPFVINADRSILTKLGLPNIDNIDNAEAKVKGKLILPDRYYNATLFIGEIRGDIVECDLSYGDEELSVYDLELKDLPWPIILTPDIIEYANATAMKSWPETPCNFPMVYKPEIAELSGYESFLNFTNHYYQGSFRENKIFYNSETEEDEYKNHNVLVPHVYALEVLRFIYSLEGKTIKGPAVENELLRKLVYMPDGFLEKFRGSEYQNFSFSIPDSRLFQNDRDYGVYSRQFTLQNEGTYELEFKLNLDPVTAKYFNLKIYREDPNTGQTTRLYTASSVNNRVTLEEKLTINVEPSMVFDFLKIDLNILYTPESIASYNQFELSFEDGQLNEFPSYFSLSQFMPDMTAGEYVNNLKNWLNLDFDIKDAEVIIGFTQDSVLERKREDHRHLEIPKPYKKRNSNRFYKLKYANGDQVFYNKNGQVFSKLDEEGDEVITINMEVQPAVIERNEGVTTAVYPTDPSDFDFCIYDGFQNSLPVASAELTSQLSLQNVFEMFWELWLRYRVNSKSFRETFSCSVHETINLRSLIFKYNELHLIKKLKKKFESEEEMRVEIESETF